MILSAAEAALADDMARFYADPLGWVLYAFPWGEGDLAGFDGPDVWQEEFLRHWGEEIRRRGFDGVHPVPPIREATASGHGIGKSALVAWCILFIMSTRPMSKGVVTANTGDQLRTKTWSELAKWHSRCVTRHWFEMTTTSISHKVYSEQWRADALTCREENSEAFAGLHAAESTPWYIFDEASAVPNKIWEVARGGLTDGEPMHFVFGNPTRNIGGFYDCFSPGSRWNTRTVDSRDTRIANKVLIQEWLEDYGEDSDFFRVRARGMFPRAGDMQFISTELVADAMRRDPGRYLPTDPLIASLDMARGGDDDCRLGFRQGYDARSRRSYRIPGEKSRDSTRVVSKVAAVLKEMDPDIVFVDETGLGGPVCDRLVQLGFNAVGIGFGWNADDELHYANKTAEMGARFERWLRAGGALPYDPQLEREITCREFWHDDKDRLVLSRKKDIKKLLGFSPDWADQLYLTFAQEVPQRLTARGSRDARIERDAGVYGSSRKTDYDPLDAL